ncbi:hypothetical protein CAPTEDRAFT_200060 [Capitella teleta]|uniref:TatD related DNase n=1 Tax=Capitella teleta TaxID=283909 RepID=R7TQE9_CAPTE|nr:hypothetical protein CAPTEDRAFT_200060 [Capitella teleta]|eukprot:ELT95864.1 hypothetical protein CAPTEDRAFT_200060 [Capitella teleta]
MTEQQRSLNQKSSVSWGSSHITLGIHIPDSDLLAVDSHFHLDKLVKAGHQGFSAVADKIWKWLATKVFPCEDSRVFKHFGVHPSRVDTCTFNYLEELKGMLASLCCVAIGEINLDYSCEITIQQRNKQQAVFCHLLALAVEVGKPVVVHCRDFLGSKVESDCLTIMREELPRFHMQTFEWWPEAGQFRTLRAARKRTKIMLTLLPCTAAVQQSRCRKHGSVNTVLQKLKEHMTPQSHKMG